MVSGGTASGDTASGGTAYGGTPLDGSQPLPPLVIRAQGTDRTLQPGGVYRIGRDPAADIVIEEPLVSWHHAVLTTAEGQWLLEDTAS